MGSHGFPGPHLPPGGGQPMHVESTNNWQTNCPSSLIHVDKVGRSRRDVPVGGERRSFVRLWARGEDSAQYGFMRSAGVSLRADGDAGPCARTPGARGDSPGGPGHGTGPGHLSEVSGVKRGEMSCTGSGNRHASHFISS